MLVTCVCVCQRHLTCTRAYVHTRGSPDRAHTSDIMQWRSSLVVLCVGIGAIGKQHLAEGRASNVYCVVQGRALVRVSNVDLSISGDQRSGDLASHESVGLVVELGNGASRTMLMAVVGRARRMVAVGFGERRANGSAVGVVQGDEAREVGEREVRARAGIGAADGRDVDDVVAALAHERAVHVGERVGAHLSCRDAREQQAMQRRQALRIASVEVGIALAEDGLHLLQAPDRDGGVKQICTQRSVSQSHTHTLVSWHWHTSGVRERTDGWRWILALLMASIAEAHRVHVRDAVQIDGDQDLADVARQRGREIERSPSCVIARLERHGASHALHHDRWQHLEQDGRVARALGAHDLAASTTMMPSHKEPERSAA